MRRADRLIELIGHLKGDALTTAADLAGRLEVSVRTVYRDVAALMAQGFPIEGEAGVGYMLRGPVDLPPLAFDHDELEAMALGLAYVGQVGDPALVAAARTARAKIDGAWAGAKAPGVSERKLRVAQRPERRAPASPCARDHPSLRPTRASALPASLRAIGRWRVSCRPESARQCQRIQTR